MQALAHQVGYEAKKRAIAGVLVSFLNKVARLMGEMPAPKEGFSEFP
jgi:hypothetical protein